MSSDDNKPNAETPKDDSESRRPSPVVARDVAADPSKLHAHADDAKTTTSQDSAAPHKALPSTKPVTSLTDKLKAAKFKEEHPDAIVTQQGVSPQDADEDATQSLDLTSDAPSPEDEEDLGVFLEEIFPESGGLPEFSVPGTHVTHEDDDTVIQELAVADESSTDVRGSGPSQENAQEPPHPQLDEEQHPVETSLSTNDEHDDHDEPVDEHEHDEPVDDQDEHDQDEVDEGEDDEDDVLTSPSRDDFFEDVDLSEPHDEEDDVQEDAQDDTQDEDPHSAPPVKAVEPPHAPVSQEPEEDFEDEIAASIKILSEVHVSDERKVPIPAVALSPSASPGAPLDTEGLPVTEHDVRGLLERIGGLALSCNMNSLSKEIHQERLPTLDGGRITLVVLGEFNHGKSTVINALLGDEVLPMGITPTTAVITHLVHADEPIVTIQPAHHGTPYTIAYDEMEQAVKESGAEGEEPEYVEIGFPNKVLSSSLVLVDTPGVNDISRQKVEITYGYLPRADVILYVLDATQVLKKSEVTFIKDRLLKSSSDRIIFVLNKIDALSPDDIEEVVDYARERLTAILGPVELFTFSGRRALQAQMKGSELPSEFLKFQSYLQRFLQEQRAFIILDSALSGGMRVSTLMEQNLAIKRQGYQLERSELEKRITAVRSRLKESRRLIAENTQLIDSRVQGIAATAKHNLRIFTEQFSEQLPLQIDRADASDVKKFLPTWIQETYKEWLEQEGNALARSLEELAEEIIQITNESLQQTVRSYQKEFGLTDELDLNVDTVAYDVSVFALGAFGVSIFLFANIIVGSLLTLATPLLAYMFKEKVETRIKERAREQGAEAIKTASEKLEEEILRVIHGYGDRLKEFVEMAGDRLYRQIEEALEEVQRETSGEYDREALLASVTAHLKSIALIQDDLISYRSQLEEWATSQDFT